MKENLVLKVRLCSSIVYHLDIILTKCRIFFFGVNVSMKIQYLKFASPIMN